MSQSFFWSLIKNKQRAIQGLTLVEILVTVTILGVIAAGVGMSFFSGLKLWDRVRNVDFLRNEFLLDMNMIARDLRQSVNVPSIGFEGEAKSFSFPAVESGVVVKVTYAVDATSGLVTRRVQSLKNIMAGRSEDGGVPKTVLSVNTLKLQYLSVQGEGPVWVDIWSKEQGIFKAIRLEGTFKSGSFSQIVIIPVA